MKALLIGSLCLISIGGFGQSAQPFTLKGSIKNFSEPVEKVILSYRTEEKVVIDSVVVKNGTYQFQGKIEEPVRVQLTAKAFPRAAAPARGSRKNIAGFFIAPGTIETVSVDSFNNITIKGSKAQDEFLKVEAALKPFNEKAEMLNKQYMAFNEAKNEAGKSKVLADYKALSNQSKQVYKKYLQANSGSPISMYVLNQYAGYDINSDEVDPLYNALPASIKSYPSYKNLGERLVVARKLAIGKPAIEFTQNDTLGNPVSLSSFKGKFVLVDFWASWCGPCRGENPNVVSAFNKYKDKGFTVLGVSLDQPTGKERWIKAIHDDKLTWTHVSDLKFWDNEAAKLYGIRAIPFNVLLDKEGKIVARNIRGEELQTKLAEIFN